MHKRTATLALLLAIVAVSALLMPFAEKFSKTYAAGDVKDADHMIKPMLSLLEESPQKKANVPVEAMMELEDAWAIEDTREESADGHLVSGMRWKDSELGFDAQSNTFYCTLGMNNEDDWPELELFAQPANGNDKLQVAWIDDYTYDLCADAIREGYRYELLAYTQTEYAYFGLVFTGLPLVTLHVDGGQDALGEKYVAARMSVSSTEHEALNSGAWVHLRGGGELREYAKWSYRVEFHEYTERGNKKASRCVLGMPADTDWLLLGCGGDPTCARNELAWALWRDWNEGGLAFMTQQSQMVELFVEDEYVGIYQLLQRVDVEKEITKMGGNPQTDCTARVIKAPNLGKKANADWMDVAGIYGELRYAPSGMTAKAAFDRFDSYIAMSAQDQEKMPDEEFIRLCEETVDVKKMLEYFLFIQAAGLGLDNYYNNVYMWALWNGHGYTYYLSPWDMDQAFEPMIGQEAEDTINLHYKLCWRMLNLNVGNARQLLWDIWNEKRSGMISDDGMYNRIQEFEDMINQSGAYLRESEKYQGEAQEMNLAEIQAYAVSHLSVADRMFGYLWPIDQESREQ